MKKYKIFFIILFYVIASLINRSSISSATASDQSDYFISSKELLIKIQEHPEIALIDVRESSDYEKIKIHGSLNIPLFAIKTKSYLRSNEMILIGKGYENESLKKECMTLNVSGFKARVLYGGLNSWQEEGGVLQGDSFIIKDLNKIKPVNIFSEKFITENLIIDLSESGAGTLLPNSIPLAFKDSKSFINHFRELLNRVGNKWLSVTILNENGDGYENIEAAIRTTGVKNIFYLTGGLDSYKRFVDEQAMIQNPGLARTNAIDNCGTCP
jgi:rhodanese-related sulfurtransferase